MKNPKRIVTTTIINILRFKLSEFYIIFYLYETKILQYTWKSAVRREKKKTRKEKKRKKNGLGSHGWLCGRVWRPLKKPRHSGIIVSGNTKLRVSPGRTIILRTYVRPPFICVLLITRILPHSETFLSLLMKDFLRCSLLLLLLLLSPLFVFFWILVVAYECPRGRGGGRGGRRKIGFAISSYLT